MSERGNPGSSVPTFTVAGQRFVILPESDYRQLRARSDEAEEGPAMPTPDAQGNYPAVEALRVSLARKIIRRRRAAGLTQVALARRAGICPETLNRLEQGRHTPTVATVDKLDRALAVAEAEQAADLEPARPKRKKRRGY